MTKNTQYSLAPNMSLLLLVLYCRTLWFAETQRKRYWGFFSLFFFCHFSFIEENVFWILEVMTQVSLVSHYRIAIKQRFSDQLHDLHVMTSLFIIGQLLYLSIFQLSSLGDRLLKKLVYSIKQDLTNKVHLFFIFFLWEIAVNNNFF